MSATVLDRPQAKTTRRCRLAQICRRYNVRAPERWITRPVQGEVPTLDLILAYHKANTSPMLKLLLSKVGKLVRTPA